MCGGFRSPGGHVGRGSVRFTLIRVAAFAKYADVALIEEPLAVRRVS